MLRFKKKSIEPYSIISLPKRLSLSTPQSPTHCTTLYQRNTLELNCFTGTCMRTTQNQCGFLFPIVESCLMKFYLIYSYVLKYLSSFMLSLLNNLCYEIKTFKARFLFFFIHVLVLNVNMLIVWPVWYTSVDFCFESAK